ncbi:unnamed protein product [Clonostachys chloroleuca]|uniref:Uncharacterized protein n=1 Tax=Clonostachys chloroleuca TaxID=1926264 RepID=A0AA35PY87_9HYPO|nr:unnamed protein product [Clonostachys chloroleuca]
MTQPNTPLHAFLDRSTPTPTLHVGSQFALTPTKQSLPDPMIAASPSDGGIMGSNPASSDRDIFSNSLVDEDSLLLRGGNLHDGAEAQFQPDGPETLKPVTYNGVVRGGSIAVLGPQSSKDLSETLAHRVQMAKVKAKLPDQDC